MTDISKYKSVAVKLPVWSRLQSFAGQDLRSVGKVIEWLVDKENKVRKRKKLKNGVNHFNLHQNKKENVTRQRQKYLT